MRKVYTCFLFIGLVLLLFSCKKEDPAPIPNNPKGQPQNPSELKYFVIDTAKVLQVSSSGSIETVLLNRRQNSSSYIEELSISDDGSKFVYIDAQNDLNSVYTNQIRHFIINSQSDQLLYSTTTDDILSVTYCSKDIIHFARKNRMSNVLTYATINGDGSGLKEFKGYFSNIVEITGNRRFTLLSAYTLGSSPSVSIIDSTLDGGAGTYHSEPFASADNIYNGTFTADGKKAVIPYRDGGDIKIRIVDIDTKTSTTKTIITGLSQWSYVNISMSHDNNNGVLAIYGGDFPTTSKVYLFKLDDTTISSFDNQNKEVYQAYVY